MQIDWVVEDTAVKTSNEYVECAEAGKTASSTESSAKCSRPMACDDIRTCFPALCPTEGSSPSPISHTALPTAPTVGAYAQEALVLGPVTRAQCSLDTNTPCEDKTTEAADSAFSFSATDFVHTLADDVVDVVAVEYVMVEADLDTALSTRLESGIDCKQNNITCALSTCTLEYATSNATVSTNTEPRVTIDKDHALLIFTEFSFCTDSFVFID